MAGRVGQFLRRHALPIALLMLVAAPAMVWRSADSPRPWFDEGLRTNMARTLVVRHQYGTFTSDGLDPFPPIPSSGPLEIAAIAGSFGAFGIGMAQARLPMALLGCVALSCLYGISQWWWGRAAALFAVLCVLAAPAIGGAGFVSFGRQALGEMPALALALVSAALLFAGWEKRRSAAAIAAGAAAAMAALSKGQVAIGLGPALVAGSWIWCRRSHSSARPWFLSLAGGAALPAALWWSAQLAATSPGDRVAHRGAFLAQVLSHVLVFDSPLPLSALPVCAVLVVGLIAAAWSIRTTRRRGTAAATRAVAQASFAVFIGVTMIWYVSLSRGWPRYAFAALVLSQLFAGNALWNLLRRAGLRSRFARRALIATLAAATLVAKLADVAASPPAGEAQAMANRIGVLVPRHARIESAEWEIDALGPHWLFHHPPAEQVRTAIEQASRGVRPALAYPMLAADPDFLLKGPFSDWVRIYDDGVLARDFVVLETIGPYSLFRRRRSE